jgi:hypothetical protein
MNPCRCTPKTKILTQSRRETEAQRKTKLNRKGAKSAKHFFNVVPPRNRAIFAPPRPKQPLYVLERVWGEVNLTPKEYQETFLGRDITHPCVFLLRVSVPVRLCVKIFSLRSLCLAVQIAVHQHHVK